MKTIKFWMFNVYTWVVWKKVSRPVPHEYWKKLGNSKFINYFPYTSLQNRKNTTGIIKKYK